MPPPETLEYFTPPKDSKEPALLGGVRRAKQISGWVTLATLIFFGLNAGDRDPLQWPAMFVFMASLLLYLWTGLMVWMVQLANYLQARLRRPR